MMDLEFEMPRKIDVVNYECRVTARGGEFYRDAAWSYMGRTVFVPVGR